MKTHGWAALFLLGCGLMVAGVAVVYWPMALILAGVMAVGVAVEANR